MYRIQLVVCHWLMEYQSNPCNFHLPHVPTQGRQHVTMIPCNILLTMYAMQQNKSSKLQYLWN